MTVFLNLLQRGIILFVFLTLMFLSSANKFQYFDQHDETHTANALDSKYPELGVASSKGPAINDPKLRAEVVFRGLRYPTSMAFLGPNDILVTEKDAGTVRRIVNGTMFPQPL